MTGLMGSTPGSLRALSRSRMAHLHDKTPSFHDEDLSSYFGETQCALLQSTLAPETLTALAHRGCSAAIVAANCSGLCGANGSMPNLYSCSLNSGVSWILC